MDAAAVVVPQELVAMEASKLSGFLRSSKGDAKRRVIVPPPPPGCGTGRKSLSDITNLAVDGNRARPVGQEQGLEKAAPPMGPYDDRTRLIKENSALLKLIAERNQMIEMSSIEMQKLRVTLQKTNQQNWQLAQANSQMLAEIKKADMKYGTQPNKIEYEKNDMVQIAEEACHPASQKKACNPVKKRPLRSQSLGSGVAAATKEKDEGRRRSLRRKSSNLKSESCKLKEELFEIDDIKFPIRSQASEKSAHEEETRATSVNAISYNIQEPTKTEVCEDQHQVSRRSSIGRPSRKAAEKVTCYKELPLNIKMRRD